MSKHLVNFVMSRVAGSFARKAVLLAMAERANDDGSSVWVSKTRMAAELELSRQTVVTTVQSLEDVGLLVAVGKRPGQRGYTIEYNIQPQKVALLPRAWDKCPVLDTMEGGAESVDPLDTYAPIVSKRTTNSVKLTDKNRPYRTKNIIGSEEKTAPPPRTASFVRWEAERERDPIKAKALLAEAEMLRERERA